jgi:hypothetical protein
MENFVADAISIADNELVLNEYRELRQYLLKRLAKLCGATTQRRITEARNLRKLMTILDVCAIIATDKDEAYTAHNVLYHHLS